MWVPTFHRTKPFIWSDTSCITATSCFLPRCDGLFFNGFAFVLLTLHWSSAGHHREFVFFRRRDPVTYCFESRHDGDTVNIYVIQDSWKANGEENTFFFKFSLCRIATLTIFSCAVPSNALIWATSERTLWMLVTGWILCIQYNIRESTELQ